MSESKNSGIGALADNLKAIWCSFAGSFFRAGKPTSDMSRAAIMVNNFFLHIHSVKTHINSLRPGYTLGMGLISMFLCLITVGSGVALMVYYNPSIENAYNSVKDINFVVFAGKLIRNSHKWAGEGMIVFVFLHMARVFYTNSYKSGREFNWLVGIVLLILTFALNLSGYLLPWDQLSYWALVIVSNIMQSPKELTDSLGLTKYFDMGGFSKELFLAGHTPGKEALTRVYLLHVVFLPVVLLVIIGVHFWRIRKDGGLTKPSNYVAKYDDNKYVIVPDKKGGIFTPNKTYGLMELAKGKTPAVNQDVEHTVLSWPNLMVAEAAVFMLCMAGVIAYSFYIDAPLKELANAMIPENPAKAPWYFLGLQELLSYSAFMGGVGLPTIALLGLALIPFLDRENDKIGIWFSGKQGKSVAIEALIVGTIVLVGLMAFVIAFGWFRKWWPDIPQIVITFINPGVIWVGFMILWAVFVTGKTGSTRMGAIALFTMFLVSYLILTYIGTELRGPNWAFYWSKSQWPIH
ncbi:cytochrome b N-terminal domain-containing protein [Candidatus Magnetobacterium casense]|uniref:Cytochrome b N-terminal domain-containing protein n=1 Tax=Candidatus Magnetobacterium casense TaxID=1455061 RepID=A0ABS6RVC0_9BACT|nr:cytochrome b N-terminal domain-containing protein [Candidatus Magnetobacterium casensis]MBV6340573.1 cytochrome b N-terminal domain-containing protein [Candidatus Magnetobacterium casensis]